MNKWEKIKWRMTKWLFKYGFISRETAINVSAKMALKRIKTYEGLERFEKKYEEVIANERERNNKKSSS